MKPMLTLEKEPTTKMKTIATKAFGTIDIDDDAMYEFPEGLYGFTDETQFALLDKNADSPFLWLQSMKDEHLAFILIDPKLLIGDYVPKVPQADLSAVDVSSVNDCIVYSIVTIPQNAPEEMTINLQGPVIFNKSKQLGAQVISDDDSHGVRVPVLKLMEANSAHSGAKAE